MKLKELLQVIEKIMKDVAPTTHFYAYALRRHMRDEHPDLLEEEVRLEQGP